MSSVPTTSTTLIRDLADPESPRWAEFVRRYKPMMEAFAQSRFPALDASDIIQETLVVLVRKIPNYVYSPKETGCFHNYLTGVLKYRALTLLQKDTRHRELAQKSVEAVPPPPTEDEDWVQAVFEIALEQLLADPSVQERTKQVFLKTAINGEKAEDVAKVYGINANAVAQIRSRMMAKLKAIVADLQRLDDLPHDPE